MKNKISIFHVNDYPELFEYVRETLSPEHYEITNFEDIMDATTSPKRVDLLIIDMSCVAPIYFGAAGSYSQMYRWICKHPNVPIIIQSGVSIEFVEELRERLKELGGVGSEAIIEYAPTGSDFKTNLLLVMEGLGFDVKAKIS